MDHSTSESPVHCYTNPSFCRQSEFIPGDRRSDELPPPPQFQASDDLPPPSPSPPPPPPLPHTQQHLQHHQQQQQQQVELLNRIHYNTGYNNPAFQYRSEQVSLNSKSTDRYCCLDERKTGAAVRVHENYVSRTSERRPIIQDRDIRSRYEYIVDEDNDDNEIDKIIINNDRDEIPDELPQRNTMKTASSRYAFIDNPTNLSSNTQVVQAHSNNGIPTVFSYQRRDGNRSVDGSRYAIVPVNDESTNKEHSWIPSGRNTPLVLCQRSNSTRGRYARVPTQDVLDPPILPDRNQQILHADDINCVSPKNNVATQKLHEILTTPRKPRSRSEERTLSPSKRQQIIGGTGPRSVQTPTGSPSSRFVSSPSRAAAGTPNSRRDQRQLVQVSTPRGSDLSSNGGGNGPHTSTPNKESSARRCLPLNLDNSTSNSRLRDPRDIACPASNCGRLRYPQRNGLGQSGNSSSYGIVGSPGDPPPRYAYLDGLSESIPMVSGSPRYQVVVTSDEKNVESAFIARTAVVPPLSAPTSEANTTLASGLEKSERRNAPLLLFLVGILTCGLALYLSWSQGRRYYLDSAAGCGACCALAGACRSLRRTWTGLGLAGLSALSCAGLLLIAAKAPRPGTPLHDVTAGALCGVSLLGASLALIALVSPKCNIARHRRVHSWIPRFSP